jgi:hypothetical protein
MALCGTKFDSCSQEVTEQEGLASSIQNNVTPTLKQVQRAERVSKIWLKTCHKKFWNVFFTALTNSTIITKSIGLTDFLCQRCGIVPVCAVCWSLRAYLWKGRSFFLRFQIIIFIICSLACLTLHLQNGLENYKVRACIY